MQNGAHDILTKLFLIKNRWKNVLYVHTPFCVQKCHYCVYRSTSNFHQRQFTSFYKKTIRDQIRQYSPVFKQIDFDEVYFGGGTPTIASAGILRDLYRRIPRFDSIPIKCSEASPHTITDEHIKLFKDHNFSYVSLGVQTLSKRVLRTQGRLLTPLSRLEDICNQFEKANIIYNLDLICYLDKGDARDMDIFEQDLDLVMSKLRPISAVIHSNYRFPNSHRKTALLIKAIRDALKRHPEYRCVNSLLRKSDIALDTKYYAEYRLMRKNFNFDTYQNGKYAQLTEGYNILSLGYYENIYTVSSVNGYSMHVYPDRITSIIEKLPLQYKLYCDYAEIRKRLDLPYPRVKKGNFFVDATDKTRLLGMVNRLWRLSGEI